LNERNQMEQTNVTLANVITEIDLCELLGMNKNQIGDIRRKKHLPFIKLSNASRLYFENDLIKFFEKQRVTLDSALTDTILVGDSLGMVVLG
jgi:hypothetical protein